MWAGLTGWLALDDQLQLLLFLALLENFSLPALSVLGEGTDFLLVYFHTLVELLVGLKVLATLVA